MSLKVKFQNAKKKKEKRKKLTRKNIRMEETSHDTEKLEINDFEQGNKQIQEL